MQQGEFHDKNQKKLEDATRDILDTLKVIQMMNEKKKLLSEIKKKHERLKEIDRFLGLEL